AESGPLLAANRLPGGGGEEVPLTSDPPHGDAGRDSAVAGWWEGPPATARRSGELSPAQHASIHNEVFDNEVFDTAHAAEIYPELEPLHGWSWWWVGEGTIAQLVGYHHHGDTAVDLLYIDSDTHATLTRAYPSGQLAVHQTGSLVAVLALLGVR
ncbi:MAG: hypothetical protein ACRDQ5_17345, partial [Sciscionella sp.]